MHDAVFLSITGALSQGVAFAYRVALTRLIGPEILGLYQLLMPVYAVLLSLTSAGLNSGVCNLAARQEAWQDRAGTRRVLRVALGLFFALAVLPCLLLLLGSDAASVYLLGDARTQLGLLLLVPCLLLTGVENLHKHAFYGAGLPRPPALADLGEGVLKALTILTLLILLAPETPEGTVGVIVLGMTGCEVVSVLVQLVLFRHWFRGEASSGGRKDARRLLSMALPVGGAAVLGNLLSSANAVLLPRLLTQGGMGGKEAVAVYGITFGMTLPLLMLPTAFLSALGLVLTPKLSKAHALGRGEDIRRLLQGAAFAADALLVPGLVFLVAAGPALGTWLYGEPRVGEHLPVLALGVYLSCKQTLYAWVLNALDRQGTGALIALGCDGLQLALTCLTVASFGMAGYAWSFVVTGILGSAVSWRVVKTLA